MVNFSAFATASAGVPAQPSVFGQRPAQSLVKEVVTFSPPASENAALRLAQQRLQAGESVFSAPTVPGELKRG